MEKRFKDFTIILSRKLELISFEFLMNNMDDEENYSEIINLILSSHLSSMFNCMMNAAQADKENIFHVENFINGLQEYISKLPHISSIERL